MQLLKPFATGLSVVALTFALGMTVNLPQPAFAAGSDDTTKPKECKDGEVWSEDEKKCIKKSSAIDKDLYDYGEALALDGQYERAIDVLRSVSNQNDPRVLNYIGYSFRKMGQLEKGITYYAKALAIDPNYVRAREYLGEGYVAAGRLDEARDQLVEIRQRCGTDCEEYQELAKVIVDAGGSIAVN